LLTTVLLVICLKITAFSHLESALGHHEVFLGIINAVLMDVCTLRLIQWDNSLSGLHQVRKEFSGEWPHTLHCGPSLLPNLIQKLFSGLFWVPWTWKCFVWLRGKETYKKTVMILGEEIARLSVKVFPRLP